MANPEHLEEQREETRLIIEELLTGPNTESGKRQTETGRKIHFLTAVPSGK